ncbi:Hypothetical predicted protein, partial [Pelobates cultripes]
RNLKKPEETCKGEGSCLETVDKKKLEETCKGEGSCLETVDKRAISFSFSSCSGLHGHWTPNREVPLISSLSGKKGFCFFEENELQAV